MTQINTIRRITREAVRDFQAEAKKARDAGRKCTLREISDDVLKGFKMTLSAAGSITFIYRVVLPTRKRITITLGKVHYGMTAEQARAKAIEHAQTTVRKNDTAIDVERKARLLRTISETVNASLTVGAFIDQVWSVEYLKANPMAAGRTQHVKDVRVKFADFMGMALQDVTGDMLMDWRRNRLATIVKPATRFADAQTVKPSTVNRELNNFNAVFKMAIEKKKISVHPMASIESEHRKLDERALTRTHYLTPDEEARLRDAIDMRERMNRLHYDARKDDPRYAFVFPVGAAFTDYLKPLILLTLNTGVRRKELLNLRWSTGVNLSTAAGNGEIKVSAYGTKGVISRSIPLNAEAAEVLKAWQAQCKRMAPVKSDLVFADDLGQKRTSINASAWRKLLKDADIQDFQYRDLRRSFATHAMQNGADGLAVMKWMGHTDIKTTERYIVDMNEHHQIKALDRARSAHQAATRPAPAALEEVSAAA